MNHNIQFRCAVVRALAPGVYEACHNSDADDVMRKLCETCVCFENGFQEYKLFLDLVRNKDGFEQELLARKERVKAIQVSKLLK